MEGFPLLSVEQEGAVDTAFTIPAGAFTLAAAAPTFLNTDRLAIPPGQFTFSAAAPTFAVSHLGFSDGALSRGADLKLGGYELMIDEAVPDHYHHHWQTVLADQQTIPGRPTKRNVRQEKLLFDFDDWSGGENNRIYYPDDPTVYYHSDGANGRIRGQLTGRPTRYSATLAANKIQDRPLLSTAGGKVWCTGGRNIFYSSDGVTWTAHSQNAGPTVEGTITAAAGADDYLYVSSYDGTDRFLYRVDTSNCDEVVTGGTTTTGEFMGMDLLNGRLYGWTGRKLLEYDVFEGTGLTAIQYRKVYDTGIDLLDNTKYYGDCIAGDTSIFTFLGSMGRSRVYEYRRGAGNPLWKLDYGFTVKSLVHQGGILFAGGHFGGEAAGTGRGAMYALPLDSLREVFIGWFRKDTSYLQMQEASTSYGKQILVCAALTGRVFVYDAELDAISMLDDLPFDFGDSPQLKIGNCVTYGPKRIAVVYTLSGATGSGNYTVYAWDDDEPVNRESNIAMPTMESGTWDFDFPNERKSLVGFHVTFVPLTTGQTIDLSYNLDGTGWTSLTQITTAAAGATDGRVFLLTSTGSSTKNFFNMKFRIDAAGTGSGKLPPIIYGCTPEATLLAKVELWDLIIRVKDEAETTGRPAGRSVRAEDLRAYLETLIQNQAVVTYLDGYRYQRRPGTYSRHIVMVLEGNDSILRDAEGSMSLRLMAVTET